jgi:hypothetical protein
MFMSLMKSLPMVERTEMLWRNIPEDWSVKDRTSCTKNLYLGREDNIVKKVQVEGAKCIITRGPTGAKGRPNRARLGLGRLAGPTLRVGSPPPLFLAPEGSSTLSPWMRHHSRNREPFAPRGYPQARERGGRSRRRIDQLERSTHKWRRRKTQSEASPWSTVPCLAPWWGNLLIRPWVVIGPEM